MTTVDRVTAILSTADLHRVRSYTIASDIAKSPSGMRRHLALDGETFCSLLDAERKRRAVELFNNNPRAQGKDVARVCGYTGANYAYKAFSRWFGTTLHNYKSEVLV